MRSNQTPMNLKLMNKKRVLQCIQEHEAISRAEIAVKVQISKPTASLLVDELISEKWVIEKGNGESTSQGGRKPIQLYFNAKAGYILGADIGGTKVKAILCDLRGTIIAESEFNTSRYLQSGLLSQLAFEVEQMIQKSTIKMQEILGMGVGIPGVTESKSGLIIDAPSLNWVQYPFLTEAKRYFSFPIYIDNDVNAAALGEQWLGNAQNKKNVLFIAVGTGIGSGIIINNQLYRGATSAAGEIGYMVTNKNDMKSAFRPIFQRYGYLESVAGGKSIGINITEAIQKQPDHPLYEQAKKEELSGELAFSLAEKGDKLAEAVIEDAIEHLAYGIINAASLLNPEVIILGGGVFKSADYILPKLRSMITHYLPSAVKLKTSQLGEKAGVLGAVSLFLHEHDSLLHYQYEGDYY